MKQKLNDFGRVLLARFFLSVFFTALMIAAPLCAASVSESKINFVKPYIVSVKSRYSIAAYSSEGSTFGSGCIVNAEHGIIVTNAHVVGRDRVVDAYEITLQDGREIPAKVAFVHPWHDIAFLKVDPKFLKHIKHDLKFYSGEIKEDESVFMIGKNENKHFSTQTGIIASTYESSQLMPGQVFRISLNAQRGASGSPVFSMDGKLLGIVHASNIVTCAFAIPVSYIQDILNAPLQGKTLLCYGAGAILEYVSIDELVRFHNFPTEKAETYRKAFPKSFNRMLRVATFLRGSPADGLLEPGDVIEKVNGKEIGPNLYEYDALFNKSGHHAQSVELTVIRNGHEKKIEIKPYQLNARTIKRLVLFGGAVFYEADDEVLYRTGAPSKHRVFISNIRPGSSFYEKLPIIQRSGTTLVAVTQIDNRPIKNLDDIVRIVPSLIKKKDFHIKFVNYSLDFIMADTLTFSQAPRVQEITYARHDGIPEEYLFDEKEGLWGIKPIEAKA